MLLVRDPRVREHLALSSAEKEREVVNEVMERKVAMVLAAFGRLEHDRRQLGSTWHTKRKERRRLGKVGGGMEARVRFCVEKTLAQTFIQECILLKTPSFYII